MQKAMVLLPLATLLSASLAFAQQFTNTISAPAPTTTKSEPSKYTLKWAIELEGDHEQDELSNQTSAVYLGMKLDFDLRVNSWMNLNLTPKFVAQSGYLQSPDAANPQSSRLVIENAALNILPLSFMKLSVGSLSERGGFTHSRIFIDDISFPAARITLLSSPKATWRAVAFGESAVPVASTISDSSNNLNQTPSLSSVGVGVDGGDSRSSWESHLHVSAYDYENLPNSVMTTSVQQGNTGSPTAGSDYQLRYKYQGYEASTFERFRLNNRWSIAGWASGLENTQAPSDRNSGYLVGTSVAYDLNRDLALIPRYDYYQIGADATVASYTSQDYDTNRAGYTGELGLRLMHHYMIRAQYGERVSLIENPTQPNETVYRLKFETDELDF